MCSQRKDGYDDDSDNLMCYEEELFVDALRWEPENVVEKICSLAADFVASLAAGKDYQLLLVRFIASRIDILVTLIILEQLPFNC